MINSIFVPFGSHHFCLSVITGIICALMFYHALTYCKNINFSGNIYVFVINILEAGMVAVSLSSSKRRSYRGIISFDLWQSFNKKALALSATTHAYLSFAGFLNMQSEKMDLTGFNRKVLPQFAGPVRMMLQFLPPSCISKSFRLAANWEMLILFSSSSPLAFSSYGPWQLRTHSVLSVCWTSSIL